jgi:hypothetical protein
MYLFEAFVARLLAQAELTAIIDNKIFPDRAPAETTNLAGVKVRVELPYMVYQEVPSTKEYIYGGLNRLQHPHWQFTMYAADQLQAAALGEIVKAIFNKKEGQISGASVQLMKIVMEYQSEFISPDGTFRANTKYLEYEVKCIENI